MNINQSTKFRIAIMTSIILLVVFTVSFALSSNHAAFNAIKPTPHITSLETARQAVCDLYLPYYETAGSAIIIGRIHLPDGLYGYRAVTAFHVVNEPMEDIVGDDTMMLTFLPDFHGDQVQFNCKPEFEFGIPKYDWAIFTFVSAYRLECAELATESDFKNIEAFEDIYLVGCVGPYGPQCRKGIISQTTNSSVFPHEQETQSSQPWNRYQANYFRFSIPIWYGDSGGGIFDKYGHLIGIINALTISNSTQVVTHSGVSLKVFTIREIVPEDLFIIED